MDSEIETKLAQYVSDMDDHDLQSAKEIYKDELANLKTQVNGSVPEETLKERAAEIVKAEIHSNDRTSGEVREVEVIVIGHSGIQSWDDDDGSGKKDVMIGYGLVNIPDEPIGLAAFIHDETEGVDPHNMVEKFEPLNELVGYYSVSEFDTNAVSSNIYIADATDQTRVEVRDEDEAAPADVRMNQIREHTEKAEIINLPQFVSEDIAYGVDIKRIEGNIVDTMDSDNSNAYTVLDASVTNPEEELDERIRDDYASTPGLTCWLQTPEQMKFDVNSYVEFFGRIETMNDGQFCMNVYGVIESPIEEDRHLGLPYTGEDEEEAEDIETENLNEA